MNARRKLARMFPARLVAVLRLVRSGALLAPNARLSFSQEGEDLLIGRMFDGRMDGFYVDVGALHPTRFSNTYLLYRRGWRGINIDATPGSMKAFEKLRPRDINLEVAISGEAGVRQFIQFNEPALNSLEEDLSQQRDRDTDYRILSRVEVPVRPLRDVLAQHIPAGQNVIDFMTIDTEGHDLEVLKSNDWSRFRPRVLLIEVLDASLGDVATREEVRMLLEVGYEVHAKFNNSLVLFDRTR